MSNANFFTVGGTVQAGGGSYIPRRADTELLDLCLEGSFAYVLTPRQMGKSSLMVRTAQQLEAAGTRTVIIDLTQIGVDVTIEQWYGGILSVIEEGLELDTDVFSWWEAHSSLGVTQRLTTFFEEVILAEVDGSVVVFIDEIDTTLGIPFTDDFFAAIRFVHNARAASPVFNNLSFVLIGVATPSELIDDPKRTPFNIGSRVDLTDFNQEEAKQLADGLNLPAELADAVLGWVMKWTGGHPYLTQRLCRAIAEEVRSSWQEADVDNLVAETFFGARSEQDNNLQFVRDMLTKRADDTAAILGVYRRVLKAKQGIPDETSSAVKSHLKLSGIVRRQGKTLGLRNEIYRTVFNANWIRQQWPDPWYIRNADTIIRTGFAAILVLAIAATVFAFTARRDRENALSSAQSAEQSRLEAETRSAVFQERVTELLSTESRLNSDIAQLQLQLQERENLFGALTDANNQLQAQLADNPDNDQTIALLQEENRQNVARFTTEIATLESQLAQRSELINLLQRGSSTSSASFAAAPEMIEIPAGSFLMGSESIINEQPVHRVSINQPFALSRYEVPFEQYDIYALATGQDLPDDGGWGRGTRPVINLSWNDIQGYIQWLNDQTNGSYRLPTEAEWEYAARAESDTAYSWGDDIGIDRANCRGCNKQSIGQTLPVGRYAANAFGLYDMHGNVREWVQDCYVDSYAGALDNGRSRATEKCAYYTLRGGAWDDPPQWLRSASRYGNVPNGRYNINGFRLAQDIDP